MAGVDPVTASTKEAKKYLSAWEGSTISEEKLTKALKEIAHAACKEDKGLVHLQLFFHLPYPDDLERVLDDPGDFVFIAPGFTSNKRIPLNVYVDVVLEGGLLTHFLEMVHYLCNKNFVKELAEAVLKRWDFSASSDSEKYNLLIMLAKISRREKEIGDDGNKDFFLKHFETVLENFVGCDKLTKYEKLIALFRLAGISCMQSEDYAARGSDVLELLEEWNYDLTNRVAKDTSQYLSEFFENQISQNKDEGVRMETLMLINNIIVQTLKITASEENEWNNLKKTRKITWGEFIGVVAFLTKSMIEKHSNLVDIDRISQLMSLLSNWVLYRPKLMPNDFEDEITNFDQFYKILKRFGEKERDKLMLLKKFLDFSYIDVYCTKNGQAIGEKYLADAADFETASAYILGSLDKSKMPEYCHGMVPGNVKMIIQKLLCTNPSLKKRKLELVSEIFKNGAHSDLKLIDYSLHRNMLCSKIGTIEYDGKDAVQIEHNQELVYSTCIEDPLQTIDAMMRQSISSQNFKALQFAKAFMIIPIGPPNTNPPSVRNFCFSEIIKSTDEFDRLLNSLADSVSEMVLKDIMDSGDVYQILREKIQTLLVSEKASLKKVSKLYLALASLTGNVLLPKYNQITDEDDDDDEKDKEKCAQLLKEIFVFARNSKQVTFMALNVRNAKEMLAIRSICGKLLEMIKSHEESINNINIGDLEKSKSLLQVGNAYIRITTTLRAQICSMMEKNEEWFPATEFDQLVDALIVWANNTDVDDWPIVMEFVTKVLPKSPHFPLNLSQLINNSLLYIWNTNLGKFKQPTIRQYLKFYCTAVQYLLRNKMMPYEDQLEAIYTLVCLSYNISDSMRRRKGKEEKIVIDTTNQQVMLAILDILNALIAYNPDFEVKMKDELLEVLLMLPIQTRRESTAIRRCILDHILYFNTEKGRLIVVPKEGENQESKERKLREIADIKNLPNLLSINQNKKNTVKKIICSG